MLSRYSVRKLCKRFALEEDDFKVFENPTKDSVYDFIRKVQMNNYNNGYHNAIEDIKQIIKSNAS